jgi:excisionase family DNA binding protein
MADEEFLTTTQVAEMLQVKQKRVRQWIEEGTLPAVRTPGRERGTFRVRRGDLERVLGVSTGTDGGPS